MPFIFYSSATTGEFCFEGASPFTLNRNNKTAYMAVLIPQVIGYIHTVSSITWYVLPTVINTITLTAHQQMSITSMGASGLPSPRKTELVTFEKPNKQKNSAQMRAHDTNAHHFRFCIKKRDELQRKNKYNNADTLNYRYTT